MFLHTKKCFFTQKIFLHTKCVFFTNKMFFYKKKVFFTYKMFLHKKLFFSQIFGRIDIWLDVRIWRKKDGVSCQLNKKRGQLWIWLYMKGSKCSEPWIATWIWTKKRWYEYPQKSQLWILRLPNPVRSRRRKRNYFSYNYVIHLWVFF